MTLSINSRITTETPEVRLLLTELEFTYEKKQPTIWNELLQPLINQIEQDQVESIRQDPRIMATKKIYKHYGKDPARFRPSSESLWRRLVQQKGLYQINSLVDLNNYLSLLYKLPFGVYDAAKLSLPIELTIGEAGMSYLGIGKAAINLEGALVLKDQLGCFGGPTSDSSRGMISSDTQRALLIGYVFDKDTQLAEIQQTISQLIPDYLLNGKVISQQLI